MSQGRQEGRRAHGSNYMYPLFFSRAHATAPSLSLSPLHLAYDTRHKHILLNPKDTSDEPQRRFLYQFGVPPSIPFKCNWIISIRKSWTFDRKVRIPFIPWDWIVCYFRKLAKFNQCNKSNANGIQHKCIAMVQLNHFSSLIHWWICDDDFCVWCI